MSILKGNNIYHTKPCLYLHGWNSLKSTAVLLNTGRKVVSHFHSVHIDLSENKAVAKNCTQILGQAAKQGGVFTFKSGQGLLDCLKICAMRVSESII